MDTKPNIGENMKTEFEDAISKAHNLVIDYENMSIELTTKEGYIIHSENHSSMPELCDRANIVNHLLVQAMGRRI